MEKEKLIKRTVRRLRLLPVDKLKEADDYIEFLLKKYEEDVLIQKGIEKIIEQSDSFKFLDNEEDLYSVNDLKEKYK